LNITSSEIGRPRRRLGWRLLAAISGAAVIGSVMFANVAVFAAAGPAVNLDQCRNGGLVTNGTQTFIQCSGGGSGNSGWVNGNAGAANAHYAEGESISYRARITGLKANDQVVVIMGYDVVHGGVHAIDYLTDKNRWQTPEGGTLDVPCSGVSGCDDPADLLTAPIPAPLTNVQVDTTKTLANGCQVAGGGAVQQPVTSFNAIPAAKRVMEFFNATPAAVDAIKYVGAPPTLLDRNGDQEQQISVTFTATAANPVLAWGGHIASRLDWGCAGAPQSASGISGSPYHMRIKNITVNGDPISLGNQDRSLSAAAVIFVNPGISTTPNPSSTTIGTLLNDSATLTGALSPTGSITFKLFPPADTNCTGSAIYTESVPLNGATTVSTNNTTVTATEAGTYHWTADYPGDGSNAAASSGCAAEPVTVAKKQPSNSTAQSLIPDDSFTLSGATSNAGGTIDFYLFNPSNTCSVANAADPTKVAFHQQVAVSGNGAYSTTNHQAVTPYTATAEGTYQWLAVYSGDANNEGTTSLCLEQFTIDNNNSN
jgi:hypothetical protein